jgi:ankyrin repeat protein
MLFGHGADINHQGGIYHSVLRAGLYTGGIATAKALDRGATFDDEVFLVAIANERSTITPKFLRRGANCNAQTKEGCALQLAIEEDDLETALVLLQSNGIDVNCKGGKRGGNPLYSAVSKGNETVVLKLLDRGAAINAEGGEYNYCLGAAAIGGYEQLVHLLLDRGINVDGGGGYHGGPLIYAVSQEHENIVRLLLDRGVDINASGVREGM